MRPLLPATIGLSLLLTACPQYKPVDVPVSDPNVLSGAWTGTLKEQHFVSVVGENADRLFVRENAGISAYNLLTGQLEGALNLPSYPSYDGLKYRRDGTLLVLTDRQLLTYDAATLTQRSAWTLPSNASWQLSRDGTVLLDFKSSDYSVNRRYFTPTGALLPTATVPTGEKLGDQSSDQQWWMLYTAGTQASTYRVVRADTGEGFPVPVKTTSQGCSSLAPGLEAVPITASLEPSPAQQVLLISQPDGTVEVRDHTGAVLREVKLLPAGSSCGWVHLSATGTPGLAVFQAGPDSGMLNVHTGEVLHRLTSSRTDAATTDSTVLISGTFVSSTPATPPQPTLPEARYWFELNTPSYTFQPWTGTAWSLPSATAALDLNVKTERADDWSANITGTVSLDGKVMNVAGKLQTAGTRLKAQTTPIIPGFYADLTVTAGTQTAGHLVLSTYLPLTGTNPVQVDSSVPPTYLALWFAEGQPGRSAGLLKRQ